MFEYPNVCSILELRMGEFGCGGRMESYLGFLTQATVAGGGVYIRSPNSSNTSLRYLLHELKKLHNTYQTGYNKTTSQIQKYKKSQNPGDQTTYALP